jgi:hypothetical protein
VHLLLKQLTAACHVPLRRKEACWGILCWRAAAPTPAHGDVLMLGAALQAVFATTKRPGGPVPGEQGIRFDILLQGLCWGCCALWVSHAADCLVR